MLKKPDMYILGGKKETSFIREQLSVSEAQLDSIVSRVAAVRRCKDVDPKSTSNPVLYHISNYGFAVCNLTLSTDGMNQYCFPREAMTIGLPCAF